MVYVRCLPLLSGHRMNNTCNVFHISMHMQYGMLRSHPETEEVSPRPSLPGQQRSPAGSSDLRNSMPASDTAVQFTPQNTGIEDAWF